MCRKPEARGEGIDPGLQIEMVVHPGRAGRAELPAPLRVGDQPRQRRGQGRAVAGRHQDPGDPIDDQFRNTRQIGRDTGEPLALRLDQDVGQSVAIAVDGDLGGEHE